MTNYRLILYYYSKGNNHSQVATICQCSRTTVIKAVRCAKAINLTLPVSDKITDMELLGMLYPKRGRRTEYAMPDFEKIRKDKVKRHISLYIEWRRYYKRTIVANQIPYKKSQFYKMYKEHFSPKKAKEKRDIISKIESYKILLGWYYDGRVNETTHQNILREKREWFEKMRLDESKV